MVDGQEQAGIVVSGEECEFGNKAGSNSCKSEPTLDSANTISLCPIYLKYKDHVIFKNIPKPSPAAVIRETIGWIKQENDELLLIEHDRAVPGQGKNVNGIIILKNCIVEAYTLPLQNNSEYHLNLQKTTNKIEYAFRPSERKTQPKTTKGTDKK
jgi:hypothetical protein